MVVYEEVYMKELKLYQCEICNTQYASKQYAEECEKSHKIIKAVVPLKYRSLKSNPEGYPDSVKIIFDNDEEIRYIRG